MPDGRRPGPASGQILRFVLVGAVNTATFYGIYRLLLPAMPYFAAYTIAFLLSMVGSFLMNTFFTYQTRATWRKFALFPLTNITNYLVQGAGLFALVHWAGMNRTVAPLAAALVAVPFTFLLSRRILLPQAATTAAPTAAAPTAAANRRNRIAVGSRRSGAGGGRRARR